MIPAEAMAARSKDTLELNSTSACFEMMKIFLHRIVHYRRIDGKNLAVHTTGIVTFIDL